MADLFLLGAEMNDDRVAGMVNGLLPDQGCRFRDAGKVHLHKDEGVPEELKDIADVVGIDFKAKLLHGRMAEKLTAPGFESARDLVWRLLDKRDNDRGYDESAALKEIIDALEEALPDDHEFSEDSDFLPLQASARLMQYLWKSNGEQHLRKCPLLTSAGRIVRLAGSQQILAPVSHWPGSARP